MRSRHIFVIVLVMRCALLSGSAQDLKAALTDMRSNFQGSASLNIKIEVAVFDSAKTMPFYRQLATIKKSGDNYLYLFDQSEMLMNEAFVVVIDKAAMIMQVSKRSPSAEAQFQKGVRFNVDSVMRQYEGISLIGKRDSLEHYRVSQKEGAIKAVNVFFSPRERLVREIAYEYKGGEYASISFRVFEKDIQFEAETFSIRKYGSMVNGTFHPSPPYKKFNLTYRP